MVLITWSNTTRKRLVTRDNPTWLPSLPQPVHIDVRCGLIIYNYSFRTFLLRDLLSCQGFQFFSMPSRCYSFDIVKGVFIKSIKTKYFSTLFINLFNYYSSCVDFVNARSISSEGSLLFFSIFCPQCILFKIILENILPGFDKKVLPQVLTLGEI